MKNLILNIILLISISMNSQSIDLLNPEKNIGLDNWNIVNDDVMGEYQPHIFQLVMRKT